MKRLTSLARVLIIALSGLIAFYSHTAEAVSYKNLDITHSNFHEAVYSGYSNYDVLNENHLKHLAAVPTTTPDVSDDDADEDGFFDNRSWGWWVGFVLFVILMIILIILLLILLLPEAAGAAIIAFFAWLLKLIFVRFLYGFVWRYLIVGGFTWLRAVAWPWLRTVAWPWLTGWLRSFLGGLVTRFPFLGRVGAALKRAWAAVGDNALWDGIKWVAVGTVAVVVAIAKFFSPEGKTIVPCGSSQTLGPITVTYTAKVRDYPFGKSGTTIHGESVTNANAGIRGKADEEIQKLVDGIECAPGCHKVVGTMTYTAGGAPTVKKFGYGIFDTYEATATATASIVVQCVHEEEGE